MKIFVTGASGWIGSATVSDLLEAGHEVVGLARSEESAQRLEAAGAIVHRGDLDEPDGLAKAAADSDGVIHLAFQHEVAFGGDFPDRRSGGPAGSGGDGCCPGRFGPAPGARLGPAGAGDMGGSPPRRTAWCPAPRFGPIPQGSAPPPASSCSRSGVSGSARPCCVSRRPFMATATTASWPPSSRSPASVAVSGYVGDGANRWPAVHRSDAARLARLAVEAAPAGSVLHAVGDGGVPFREIAEAMGRHLDVPTASVSEVDAAEHFAPLGHFVGLDSPASACNHSGAARLGANRTEPI